ncbi:hypothetical protein KUM39_06530 [Streptomyces sp. J2-1]|uniref:hypothetical protein n=1 Tax=Streptomyces corallincola TaxID=2851888 RepID=UPI001C3887FF|nr:hypothetical protein [Streptomyces corallincola]MBV2354020.1 hypothetical protein [Streptomyces corallincola]
MNGGAGRDSGAGGVRGGAYAGTGVHRPAPWTTAYVVVVCVLCALACLVNALVFFVSVFSTDNCSLENPVFRCGTGGILLTMLLPWAGLAAAVGAALGATFRRRGWRLWGGLPLAVLVYAAGVAGTFGIMMS